MNLAGTIYDRTVTRKRARNNLYITKIKARHVRWRAGGDEMTGQISVFSVIRKDFDIKEYIPVGSENAVTRKYLSKVTGLSDRRVRHAIHEARRDIPILNLSDGNGYYIPDMNKQEDQIKLLRYVRQEENRLKSIGWALKAARKTLRNCGVIK